MENQHFKNDDMGIFIDLTIGYFSPDKLLSDKIILITGGAQGIGFSIANACIKQGASVIITGRNRESLLEAEKKIGGKIKGIVFNVNKCSQYDEFLDDAEKVFGHFNCLVNNAGISLHEGDFLNVTEFHWDQQLNTNLKAPYFLTQAWYKRYLTNNLKNGRVVMMASDTSGMGSSIPYGLSKAGIASLTRGLAKKFVTKGIRINAIAPGTTLTPMTEDFTHGEVCRNTTAGKRALFPDEIAQTAVFLLSDLSTSISGQVIGCTEANICFDNSYFESETNP